MTWNRRASARKTDYDRLILEITTDGTLEPARALHRAAVLLSGSLHIFTIEGEEPGTVAVSTGADAQQEPISMTGSVSGAGPRQLQTGRNAEPVH